MAIDLGASSAVLAFVTTIHVAFVVLRAHRSPSHGFLNPVRLVSVLFAGSPWVLSSPMGLAAGLAAQVAWFAACERYLIPASTPAPARRPSPPAVPAAGTPLIERARRPTEFASVSVLAVVDETPDIRTFRLARPDHFTFRAGQFVTVRVRADGREHVRCYSISSAPGTKGYFEITVRRLGVVSRTLHATLRPGSTLTVRPPAGSFLYPEGEDRPIVLVAGGVGITPLMSMLRHSLQSEPNRPVSLYYSVRTEDDVAFRQELALLADRHPRFRVFVAVTDAPAPAGFFPGRLNEDLFRATMPDITDAECLVCGPAGMMDALTAVLAGLGVPASQIRSEVFQAAIAASGGKALRPQDDARPASAAGFEARFERSSLSARVPSHQTLLDASEACGAGIPSLCRAGVCGTCRTRVVSGDVDCASNILDDQDRADGYVLPCVSHLRSDCTVDA